MDNSGYTPSGHNWSQPASVSLVTGNPSSLRIIQIMHADVHVCTASETHLFQLINDLMCWLLIFSWWHEQKHSDKYGAKADLHLVWGKWAWNCYQILDSWMLLRYFKGLRLHLKSQRKQLIFPTCRCFSSWSSSWLHRSTSTCLGCRRVQRYVGRGYRNHRPSWWEPPGWGSTPPATQSWKSLSAWLLMSV